MTAWSILVPAGHGKTHHALKRIRAIKAAEPLAPIAVILPNQIRSSTIFFCIWNRCIALFSPCPSPLLYMSGAPRCQGQHQNRNHNGQAEQKNLVHSAELSVLGWSEENRQ